MPLAVIFFLCGLRRARLQIFLSAVLLNPAFPVVFLPKARYVESIDSENVCRRRYPEAPEEYLLFVHVLAKLGHPCVVCVV